mmetsp:Transcript_43046/g.89931  ORF Transcript_43046/g.89931 Transcript_43046/m.89931 type:complete len:244 (-) Transcript_43046:931-1662(-)
MNEREGYMSQAHCVVTFGALDASCLCPLPRAWTAQLVIGSVLLMRELYRNRSRTVDFRLLLFSSRSSSFSSRDAMDCLRPPWLLASTRCAAAICLLSEAIASCFAAAAEDCTASQSDSPDDSTRPVSCLSWRERFRAPSSLCTSADVPMEVAKPTPLSATRAAAAAAAPGSAQRSQQSGCGARRSVSPKCSRIIARRQPEVDVQNLITWSSAARRRLRFEFCGMVPADLLRMKRLSEASSAEK